MSEKAEPVIEVHLLPAGLRPSRRLRFRWWLFRRRLTVYQRDVLDANIEDVQRDFIFGPVGSVTLSDAVAEDAKPPLRPNP